MRCIWERECNNHSHLRASGQSSPDNNKRVQAFTKHFLKDNKEISNFVGTYVIIPHWLRKDFKIAFGTSYQNNIPHYLHDKGNILGVSLFFTYFLFSIEEDFNKPYK